MSCSKFPELNFNLNDYFPVNSLCNSEVVVIGERRFNLNKSRSKFISIGVARDFDYKPCVKLAGNKSDGILLTEQEWCEILNNQKIITNYLYSNDATDTIYIAGISISFEQISSARVVRISKNNLYVYLGYESVCKLWELLPLVRCRLDMVKKLQFNTFYQMLRKGLKTQNGNVFVNATNILTTHDDSPTENASLALELMYLYPDIFEEECSQLRI